jgi:hypothetical protein
VLPEVGNGWLRSASTTWSPALSPDRISVKDEPMTPTVIRLTAVWPPDSVVTEVELPVRCSAEVGTVTVAFAVLVMIDTDAVAPSWSCCPVVGSEIVTG